MKWIEVTLPCFSREIEILLNTMTSKLNFLLFVLSFDNRFSLFLMIFLINKFLNINRIWIFDLNTVKKEKAVKSQQKRLCDTFLGHRFMFTFAVIWQLSSDWMLFTFIFLFQYFNHFFSDISQRFLFNCLGELFKDVG